MTRLHTLDQSDSDLLGRALPFLADNERTEYLEQCARAKQEYEAQEIIRITKSVIRERLVDIALEEMLPVKEFAE